MTQREKDLVRTHWKEEECEVNLAMDLFALLLLQLVQVKK